MEISRTEKTPISVELVKREMTYHDWDKLDTLEYDHESSAQNVRVLVLSHNSKQPGVKPAHFAKIEKSDKDSSKIFDPIS